ncbi:MAG: hypothetical protein AABY07_00420 [Nanoarchaeota archaeon]
MSNKELLYHIIESKPTAFTLRSWRTLFRRKPIYPNFEAQLEAIEELGRIGNLNDKIYLENLLAEERDWKYLGQCLACNDNKMGVGVSRHSVIHPNAHGNLYDEMSYSHTPSCECQHNMSESLMNAIPNRIKAIETISKAIKK